MAGAGRGQEASPPKPWMETPCIYSAPLSREAGCNIYLKLENLQPSGSFKSRGVGNFMFRAAPPSSSSSTEPARPPHFFIASGGNAGLACIAAANTLRRPATVVVPHSTPPLMVGKLRELGADVVQAGDTWAAADAHLRDVLVPAFETRSHHHDDDDDDNAQPGGAGGGGGGGGGAAAAAARAVYVPPFDHRDIWDGAETMVAEAARQLRESDGGGRGRPAARIDGLVCSVGGGGLLCGVMQGAQKLADADGYGGVRPQVLAIETRGSASLHASVEAGELVTLPGITTVATSLGAVRVAAEAFAWTRRAGPGRGLISTVVSDREAVGAVARFLDDARLLVESACGAAIATVYNGDLRRHLGQGLSPAQWAARNIVLIVCGGSNISLEMLEQYKAQFSL